MGEVGLRKGSAQDSAISEKWSHRLLGSSKKNNYQGTAGEASAKTLTQVAWKFQLPFFHSGPRLDRSSLSI